MARRPDTRWLVRSSALALSFGCIAFAAMDRGSAQSFQGTPNVVAGQVDSLTTGTGTTDIILNGASPQAVIDWTPTDTAAGATPIAFQNAGTTTTFSQFGGGDFSVLNRILPTGAAAGRSVLLDGNIQGLVGASVQTAGGRIYFYTPNGLIIGSNARIDVGALGLTTSSPQVTTGFSGGFIDANAGNLITLTGANSASSVVIQPGAQINALQQDLNNYVAIFAPYIEQGGTINVNGSTALIAAEAGTMRWSNGLFDVQVTTGTDGDAGNRAIFHTGSTGGPASGGSGDFHRIYTVAVPKNTAITTLIASGSSLGFDVAGAADIDGNAVILTGGSDLVTGLPTPSAGAGTGLSNVRVTNSALTSALSIYATGFGTFEAVGGGLASLAGNLLIDTDGDGRVEASGTGSSITAAADVVIDSFRFGAPSTDVVGGNSYLLASAGASIGIAGSAFLDSSVSSSGSGTQTATGGLARVSVDSGASLTIDGDLSLSALASVSETQTGNATGGTAEFLMTGSGSTSQIGGDVDFDTAGLAGGVFADLSTGVAGGDGRGGTSRISVDTGPNSLTIVGSVNVEANGRGGDGNAAASGAGFGGTATIFAGPGSSINLQSDVLIEAAGTSGSVAYGVNSIVANATSGGNAQGGIAGVSVAGTGGAITIGADLSIDVSATSDGTSLAGAAGGSATGGISNISAQDGSISVSGPTFVNGVGRGGSGTSNNNGTGGVLFAGASGAGALNLGDFDQQADGVGADEGASQGTGDGIGGTSRMTASDSGAITVNGSLSISANGDGGNGSTGFGGAGRGGLAIVSTLDAGASIQSGGADSGFDVAADGGGGAGAGTGTGGQGEGGTAQLQAIGGDIDITSTIALFAGGFGGETVDGNAGAGYGGTAQVSADGGAVVTLTQDLVSIPVNVDAIGVGGSASGSGNGGDASGGQASINSFGGGAVDVVGNVLIGGLSQGGDGANGGTANGNLNPVLNNVAFAGLVATSGTITVSGTTQVLSDGLGGDGVAPGGNGGDASGGFTSIFSNGSTGAASIALGAVTVSASAAGGAGSTGAPDLAGGAGGSATAGVINVLGTADNGDLVTGDVNVVVAASGGFGGDGGASSVGVGGNGGAGGDAVGGAALLGLFDGASTGTGGSATFGNVTVLANAQGGDGGNGGVGAFIDGNGGVGGSATSAAVGSAPVGFSNDGPTQIFAVGGSAVIDQFSLFADAVGGAGGVGNVTGLGGFASSGGFDIRVGAGANSGQSGSLTITTASASLSALPGSAGAAYFGAGPRVNVSDGTAVIGVLSIDQGGAQPALAPTPGPAELSVINGALTTNLLAINTPGAMSVYLDNGNVNGVSIALTAGAFVPNSAGTVPANPGRLIGDNVDVFSGGGDIFLDAGIESLSDIFLSTTGSINAYDLVSEGQITVLAGGSIGVRDTVSGSNSDIELTAGGTVSFADAVAGQDFDVTAGGLVTGGNVDASDSVRINSDDSIIVNGGITAGIFNPTGATGAAYSVGLLAVNNVVASDISAQGQIGLGALTGSVTAGAVDAGLDVLLLARTGATIGSLSSAGPADSFVYIADSSMFTTDPTADDFDPTDIFAAAPVAMAGPIAIGDLVGGRVVVASTGNVVLGNVAAQNDVFARGGQLLAGEVNATGRVRLESQGLMSLLSATSVSDDVQLLVGSDLFVNHIAALAGSVAVQAGNDVIFFSDLLDTIETPGLVSAGGEVRMVALGGSIYDIGLGSVSTTPLARISAGNEILLLAGDSVQLNSLQAGNAAVYVASSAMAPIGGTFDNFQIGNFLETSPQPVAGSILLPGSVSGSFFAAASQGPFTIGGVNATQLAFMQSRTGLLSINGIVSAGSGVFTSAADIAIGANGGIDAPNANVQLVSLSNTGTRIGDNAGNGGYQLSAAELARVSGASVDIIGRDVANLPIDMIIGDLTVTGPLAGSTVESNTGALNFITSNFTDQSTPSGTIRITGSLAARGFTANNLLGFYAGTLQLDADAGMIEITGQGTQLSGEIVLGVQRFHAAQVTILDRLIDDPLYATRATDINTPLATPRPNGIIRAGSIDTDQPSQVLVQNTGTVSLPAGFLTFSDGPLDRDVIPAQGSIDFIVNGQTLTDSGTLTGPQVFDFLINDDNRPFFTPESTINGCLVSGATCEIVDPEPDVTEMDSEFLPSDSLTHFTEEPAKQEQEIDPEEREKAEEEAKRAPIPPPTPIISTQPLAPVIDVDEPVAGAGNPGILSSVPAPAGQGRENAQ